MDNTSHQGTATTKTSAAPNVPSSGQDSRSVSDSWSPHAWPVTVRYQNLHIGLIFLLPMANFLEVIADGSAFIAGVIAAIEGI